MTERQLALLLGRLDALLDQGEGLDALIALMAKNEYDRELSPFWRHQDGSMVTRAECIAAGNPFEGPAKDG